MRFSTLKMSTIVKWVSGIPLYLGGCIKHKLLNFFKVCFRGSQALFSVLLCFVNLFFLLSSCVWLWLLSFDLYLTFCLVPYRKVKSGTFKKGMKSHFIYVVTFCWLPYFVNMVQRHNGFQKLMLASNFSKFCSNTRFLCKGKYTHFNS